MDYLVRKMEIAVDINVPNVRRIVIAHFGIIVSITIVYPVLQEEAAKWIMIATLKAKGA